MPSRLPPRSVRHVWRIFSADPSLLRSSNEGAGEYELALSAIADAVRLSGGNSKTVSLRGYLLAKTGCPEAARQVLNTMAAASRERYVPPFAMALIHAGLEERDEMFDALEQAYAMRDVHLMYLPVDMKWDRYRSDPRFEDLLARCAFPATL